MQWLFFFASNWIQCEWRRERERQSKKHNQCKQANLSEGVQRQTKPRRWKENIAHQEIEERKEINDNSIKCQCN